MAGYDGKDAARKTWGAAPTGYGNGFPPGTAEFFAAATEFRDRIEQPWLPEVVPFHEMAGRRVLEIGSGPGFDAYKFSRAGAVYTGIDITPENIDRAKAHLAFFGIPIDVRIGDAENLSFDDATFDEVYSNGVLHHVPDVGKAFREIRRVLKPGGRFHVIVYNRRSIVYGWIVLKWLFRRGESLAMARSRVEHHGTGAAPLVNVYSPRELTRLLRKAGFKVQRTTVRKFTWHDLPGGRRLAPLAKAVPGPVYALIGRLFGWYVIATARRL